MALDATMILIAAAELDGRLKGARIDKIFMPARDTVLLQVRNEAGAAKLLVSARSGTARVHFTEETYDNPATPPAFCMLLRKYLQGGRFKGVRTVDGERLMFFDVEALNEMGDRTRLTLSVELMGRYSNLVLVGSDGRVIDALKHIDAEQSDKRRLLPGIPFTMPPEQGKLPVLSTPEAALSAAIMRRSKPLSAAVLDVCAGIGPAVCREIAFLVSRTDGEADRLGDEKASLLGAAILKVKRAAAGEGQLLSIVYEKDRPVEFSFLPLTHYTGCAAETFPTVSELLDRYYSERDRAELMKARSFDLKRQLHTLLERTVRRQHSREEELQSTEKAERGKLFGELLTASLPSLHKGMKQAEVYDYYAGRMVAIPMDPQKTPVQNAQKYYRDYRKLTTARTVLGDLLKAGEEEIAYLESVGYEVETAGTEEEFLQIRMELKDAGYLKSFRAPKGKIRKTEPYCRYRTAGGFEILAGRNNAANDRLSLRDAGKKDIWFHVKNGAGSHTVLVTGGEEPEARALEDAAMIAAWHSAERQGERIPVDYTEIRHVKKAPGQKAGRVIYTHFKTAYVTPDRAYIESMKIQ